MVTLNKKMRQLKEKMNEKTAEAKALLSADSNDVDGANKLLDEVEQLEKEFNTEKRLLEIEQKNAEQGASKQGDVQAKRDSVEKFAEVIRGLVRKDPVTAMTEGVNNNGGYTVPVDISTEIRQYKEAEFSFERYIDREIVTTNTGARTYQTKAAATPFVAVNEGAAISESNKPTFERLTYSVQDRAGFIPVTKDLINDSAANLKRLIVEWFRRKRTATINSRVLYTLTNGVTATAITDLKGLKKLINVTIGSAYNSTIFTNDDGFNWLDSLEDTQHRPLLTPVPSEPGRMQLCIGGKIVPVVQVPNSVWASAAGSNSSTVAPFLIGELSEAVEMFDRQELEIAVSDIAAVTGFNAFEQNSVLFRGIVRNDFKKKDAAAYKYATVTIAAS